MPCNPENAKIRQIWVTGTLPAPIKLLEVNESDDIEVYPTYSKDGILLIAIKRGRRERLSNGIPMHDNQGRPLYEWCKIDLFAISELEGDINIKQITLSTGENFPERDDWRVWIYTWNQLPITDTPLSNKACIEKLSRNNYATIIDDELYKLDINQLINNDVLASEILGMGYTETYTALVKLNTFNLTESNNDCVIAENSEIPIEINGFNFSVEQQKKAKIIAAAGWVKPR